MNRLWVLLLLFLACKSTGSRDSGGYAPAPAPAPVDTPDVCLQPLALALEPTPSNQLQVAPWTDDETGAPLPFVQPYTVGTLATLAIYADLQQADYLHYRIASIGGLPRAGCLAGTTGISRTGAAYISTLCEGVYRVYLQGCVDPARISPGDVACGSEQAVPGVFKQQPLSDPQPATTFQSLQEVKNQIMGKAIEAYRLMQQVQTTLDKKSSLTTQEKEFLKLANQVVQTGESFYAAGVWDRFEDTLETGPQTLTMQPAAGSALAGETSSDGTTEDPTGCLTPTPSPAIPDTVTTQTNAGYDASAYGDPTTSLVTDAETETNDSKKKKWGLSLLIGGVSLVAWAGRLYAAQHNKEHIGELKSSKKIILSEQFRSHFQAYNKDSSLANRNNLEKSLRSMRNTVNQNINGNGAEVHADNIRFTKAVALSQSALDLQISNLENLSARTPQQNIELATYQKAQAHKAFFENVPTHSSPKAIANEYLNSTVHFEGSKYDRVFTYKKSASWSKFNDVTAGHATAKTTVIVGLVGVVLITVGLILSGGSLNLAGGGDSVLVQSTLDQADSLGQEIAELFTQYHQVLSTL